MSEYIITCDDEVALWVGNDVESMRPLVRCRDCKFCHKNYCEKRISPTVSPSEIFWIPVEPDGFCKWGERK